MAKYFAHKRRWRFHDNMAGPGGGPLTAPKDWGPRRTYRRGPTGPHQPRKIDPAPGYITLDPGEYSRTSPASSAMQEFMNASRMRQHAARMGRLARSLGLGPFGSVGRAVGTLVEPMQFGRVGAEPEKLGNGWVRCCDTGAPHTDVQYIATSYLPGFACTSGTYNSCGLRGQYRSPNDPPASYGTVLEMTDTSTGPTRRFTIERVYHRERSVDFEPYKVPGRPERLQPFPMPVGPPLSDPQAAFNPRSYEDSGRTGPRNRPYREPSVDIEFGSRFPGRPRVREGFHDNLPPGARFRERKYRMGSKNLRKLMGLISAVGEGIEFLEAAHNSLPKHLRCGGCTPQRKFAIVMENLDKIDGDKFVFGLLTNQGEDWFFGKVGKESGNVAQRENWLFGPQTGPADTGGPIIPRSAIGATR